MKIDRQKVLEKYDSRCGYCGGHITIKTMQVDHMYPQASAAHWQKSYNIDIHHTDNLMPTCRTCNHYKRAHTVEGYRKLLKDLHERISTIYIVKVGQAMGMLDVKPFSGVFYYETMITNQ